MPARRHTFTAENMRAAWEAVGIIQFNPQRVLGVVKRKETKIVAAEHAGRDAAPPVPKTPRAVSRTTRTAISLVTCTTPSSHKFKALLSNLSEGFQQTIADKVVEEEAHRLYRVLMSKEKAAKTSNRKKLTEATVVISETILQLREQRERVDAAKAAKKVNKTSHSGQTRHATQKEPESPVTATPDTTPGTPVLDPLATPNTMDDIWEEMEALEVSGNSIEGGNGGVVEGAIRLRGWRSLRSS